MTSTSRASRSIEAAIPARTRHASQPSHRRRTGWRVEPRVMHHIGRQLDVLLQAIIVMPSVEPVVVRHLTLSSRGELVQARTGTSVGGEEGLVRISFRAGPSSPWGVAVVVTILLIPSVPRDPTEKDRSVAIRLPSGLSRMIGIPDLSPSMTPQEEESDKGDGGQPSNDAAYERSDGDVRSRQMLSVSHQVLAHPLSSVHSELTCSIRLFARHRPTQQKQAESRPA